MSPANDAWISQYRKGVVELAVLGLLDSERMYGSQLVEELSRRGGMSVTAGTVYPLVARLKRAGLVESTWEESPVGPPRKYYRLSREGSAAYLQMRADWLDVVSAMGAIIGEER